ncbi:hypothetical protein J2741_000778 [Methanolinea mesophila]|uniref:C45 family autoproteolytic acyltransferase/hydolase n=1 Tax=Methanolinea mesophila TaxID=547055 RepID=UPI001AE90200|nr:C45 family peptidase [Methanolinea mesophila]MBP1928231.1 hypothetical protein [Methanolinea mesophila]
MVRIAGDAPERGFQQGFLLASEIRGVMRSLRYLTYIDTGKEWEFFVNAARKLFAPHLGLEYTEELKGMAAGLEAAREADHDLVSAETPAPGYPVLGAGGAITSSVERETDPAAGISWLDLLAWNGYIELLDYWWPKQREGQYRPGSMVEHGGCSAFIATGSCTSDGKVVMGHNSWDNFETGQFFNVILDVRPDEGNRILMQSPPGSLHSATDFFLTGAGIAGCETTIGGFREYDPSGVPEFIRVRDAMQYAGSLDGFVEKMVDGNNGGYANGWLLADTRSREILRLELGLQYNSVDRTKDGYFIGCNAPFDPRIRNLECENSGFADIRRHQGARQVRLTQLMEDHYGKLDCERAKAILADHHDVYLGRDNPCSRTVDGHYELDSRDVMSQSGRPLPFQPRGTVDGKVIDSSLAADWSFLARWGNSSGMPFNAGEFIDRHIQWRHLDGYLMDRPERPWVKIRGGE